MLTLISDIDGTLLGDTSGLVEFNKFVKKFREQINLVYASGRSYTEFQNAFKHEGLLYPEAFIAATGADIYMKKQGQYVMDTSWHDEINKGGWDLPAIKAVLKDIKGISPQEAGSDFKASYYIALTEQDALKDTIEKSLENSGIKAKVIISHNFYLDVLPGNCDKGEAAAFLARKMKVGEDEIVVAGDSENDIDLFLKFKHGIIVGNANEQMKEKLKGRDFYEAKCECAAGLLEGLKNYIDKGTFKF